MRTPLARARNMRFVCRFMSYIKIVFTIYSTTLNPLSKNENISPLKGTFPPVVASSLDSVKSTPTPLKSPPNPLLRTFPQYANVWVGSVLGLNPGNFSPSIERNNNEHFLLPFPRNLHNRTKNILHPNPNPLYLPTLHRRSRRVRTFKSKRPSRHPRRQTCRSREYKSISHGFR